MQIDIESILILAVAPGHLVDAIIGDMRERRVALAQTFGEGRAHAMYRADAFRSVPPLAAQAVSRVFASNWTFALGAAIVGLAILLAGSLFWGQFALNNYFEGLCYRMLDAAVVASVLCCIPRVGMPSCAFLLVLTGIYNIVSGAVQPGVGWHIMTSNWIYENLLLDGVGIACATALLGLLRLIRRSRSYRRA